MTINPALKTDAYKIDHVTQYPEGTEFVCSTWTPRKSRLKGITEVSTFGLQYYLINLFESWKNGFFSLPWLQVEKEYLEVVTSAFGFKKVDHLKALHELGYLPLTFYALPEGRFSPINCPQVIIRNTDPRFAWLVNFIETDMSNCMWQPATSATIARQFRNIGERWGKEFGYTEKELNYVDFQFHDFSYRGMGGFDAAITSGMAHLTQFKGTDTIPAIIGVKKYYPTNEFIAASVAATEHSVMCAGGKDGEFYTFDRVINKLYPNQIVSVVSDTWDLWKVLTDYIPRMKNEVLNRSFPIVIRPDSSKEFQTPTDIICGDPRMPNECEKKGVLRLLNETLGNTNGIINNARCIYGDGISLEVADKTLDRTVNELKLSPINQVFGIGSYTYQYNTRDTFGYAVKATNVVINGKSIPIYKDPVTDSGFKKSHKGIVCVYEKDGQFYYEQEKTVEDLGNCAFIKVAENGVFNVKYSFDEIRKNSSL